MILKNIPVKIIHISTPKVFFLRTNYDPRDENNWKKMFTLEYVQRTMVGCSIFLTSVLFAFFSEDQPT